MSGEEMPSSCCAANSPGIGLVGIAALDRMADVLEHARRSESRAGKHCRLRSLGAVSTPTTLALPYVLRVGISDAVVQKWSPLALKDLELAEVANRDGLGFSDLSTHDALEVGVDGSGKPFSTCALQRTLIADGLRMFLGARRGVGVGPGWVTRLRSARAMHLCGIVGAPLCPLVQAVCADLGSRGALRGPLGDWVAAEVATIAGMSNRKQGRAAEDGSSNTPVYNDVVRECERRQSSPCQERCDRCGARAYVLARIATPNLRGYTAELMFCAHHYARHESALRAMLIDIVDDRRLLASA